MEIIIGLVIIIVLCKILGVSNFALILGGLGIIELLIIAMALFFIYHTLHLLFTKGKKANFIKFDVTPKNKFKVAYYMIDDTEIPCIFPRESGFSANMYKTDRVYNVRYSRSLKKVYDLWAILTCIVGLIFSVGAVIVTFYFISQFENFM